MKNAIFRLLGFEPATMSVRKELIAGITTFLTMAYILAVHPATLSVTGMDKGALFTTTILASVLATLVMAFWARLPFALAPAMGLNAFFAYTIVLAMGYTWQFALTAVLIEGIIFILMTLTGLRERIVDAMPLTLRRAIGPGIGLFIAFIGMTGAGIIVPNEATLVALGNVHSPEVLLALFGTLLCAVLTHHRVTGALLIGMLATTVAGLGFGVTHFDGAVSTPPSVAPILCQFELDHVLSVDMLICVMTLFFLDMFDTVGTLIGVSTRAGMADKEGKMPRMKQAFMADALGTTAGAMLGTSTVSTFVESAAGVETGGRSGLTALTTAVCFALALFFAPLFLAIPSAATAPALIMVGIGMMHDIRDIDFLDYRTSLPAFICIVMMPFTSSISDGILFGLIAYVLIEIGCGRWRQVSIGSYILAAIFILKFALL